MLRGADGGGIAILRDGVIYRRRSKSPQDLFDKSTSFKKGDIVLIHHRYPTTTKNEERFNHPFCDEKNTLCVIHNGHISNYERLYKTLKRKGHKFESESDNVTFGNRGYTAKITDSEVIAHLLEEREATTGIRILNSTLVGSYALAWCYAKEEKVYLYCKDNPISVYSDRFGNEFFSSEYPKDHPFLTDLTEEKQLDEGTLYSLNKKGLKEEYKLKIRTEKKISYTGYNKNEEKTFLQEMAGLTKEAQEEELKNLYEDYDSEDFLNGNELCEKAEKPPIYKVISGLNKENIDANGDEWTTNNLTDKEKMQVRLLEMKERYKGQKKPFFDDAVWSDQIDEAIKELESQELKEIKEWEKQNFHQIEVG